MPKSKAKPKVPKGWRLVKHRREGDMTFRITPTGYQTDAFYGDHGNHPKTFPGNCTCKKVGCKHVYYAIRGPRTPAPMTPLERKVLRAAEKWERSYSEAWDFNHQAVTVRELLSAVRALRAARKGEGKV